MIAPDVTVSSFVIAMLFQSCCDQFATSRLNALSAANALTPHTALSAIPIERTAAIFPAFLISVNLQNLEYIFESYFFFVSNVTKLLKSVPIILQTSHIVKYPSVIRTFSISYPATIPVSGGRFADWFLVPPFLFSLLHFRMRMAQRFNIPYTDTY